MNIVVTGGAGYVGSHAARLLHRAGHEVWVYDNLSLGHRGAVPAGRLVEGELLDRERLIRLFRERKIEAVMHFAALASVPESVANPESYYRINVGGTKSVLDAMRAAGVSQDRAVVVYDDRDATAAARAWWLLRYFGHEHVRVLDGGYQAWLAAGLPVSTADPAATPGDFTARPGHLPLLDAASAGAL